MSDECNHDFVRGAWSGPKCLHCHKRKEDYDRIAELENALREIVLYVKPKYRSTRDKLVREGVCLSGELLHYESMPHVIHAGKKVLLPENQHE